MHAPAVVRLDATNGNNGVTCVLQRLSHEKLQFSNLYRYTDPSFIASRNDLTQAKFPQLVCMVVFSAFYPLVVHTQDSGMFWLSGFTKGLVM